MLRAHFRGSSGIGSPFSKLIKIKIKNFKLTIDELAWKEVVKAVTAPEMTPYFVGQFEFKLADQCPS